MSRPDQIWHRIVAIAAQSPSTHNTQGWRVKTESERTATLLYDRQRTLPAEDVNGDFNINNMGVFTRAMEIGAATHSHRLKYDFELDESTDSRYVPVASLSLDPSRVDSSADVLEPFLLRRTSRVPYDGRQVGDLALVELRDLARVGGHRFSWTQEPSEVRWAMELNAETIADDLQVPAIREELRRWIRLTRGEAEAKADGLWTECLNESSGIAWSMTRAPQVLRLSLARRIARDVYLKTQAGTPAIGWVAGDIRTRTGQFEAGRFLLDFWTTLTARDIYMMPYGSLYTNQASNAQVGERTGDPDFWLIFRMGYGPVPPKSYRLPVEELVLNGTG